MLPAPLVELLQPLDIKGFHREVLEQHLLDHHAELGTPVTDMVLPDHVVADEPQDVAQGVTDHRRPQMADVHLLGDIGL
jgi:hypothetical protein